MTSKSDLGDRRLSGAETGWHAPAEDTFGRRAVRWMIVVAVGSLVVTAGASALLALYFARADSLGEAERSGRAMANGVFQPVIAEVVAGDPAARDDLLRTMRNRGEAVMRANIWSADGTVVWSTDTALDGARLPLPDEAREAIDADRASAELSTLDSDQGGSTGPGIVETYAPLTAPDGRRFAVEIYSSDARVQQSTALLTSVLVPASVIILAVLELANLPIAVAMIRRVAAHSAERERLQRRALLASDRERRSIAALLHDDVVQRLTGVGYLLSSLERLPAAGRADVGPTNGAASGGGASPEADPTQERVRRGIAKASSLVRDSIATLRNLMVDIYPPNVGRGGLPDAVAELANRLRADGIEVSVDVDVDTVDEQQATLLYRAARESLNNVTKHAHATSVWLTLEQDDGVVVLQIDDDGDGLGSESTDKRTEGHLGLALLRDGVADQGGTLRLTDRPEGGARFRMELPAPVDARVR